MFEYAVNYFWLKRRSDSLIGKVSDRLSEGTGSSAVLVLWSFLISRSCLLGHIHEDIFVLIVAEKLWRVEMITKLEIILNDI